MPDGQEVVARLTRENKNHAAVLSVHTGQERFLTAADAVALTPDGQELVYAINEGGQARVLTRSIAGGPERLLARLPRTVLALAVDPAGWLFLSTDVNGDRSTWKIPLAGGEPELEAKLPHGALFSPAPAGGWRLIGHFAGTQSYRWHLVAPEQPLDAPPARGKYFEAMRYIAWAADGQSFLYCVGTQILRHFIATGEDRLVLQGVLPEGGMTLSPDGQTLFVAEWWGRATRHMIVNFDQRPRPVK